MGIGILAGITWALETITIGFVMNMTPFVTTEQAIFLAPFVSTFLHDVCASLWATLYNGIRGDLGNVWRALWSPSGKYVVLGALAGGPIGMTGYVMAIHAMGASIGAVASAMFPAIGAVLAHIFLKEEITPVRWCFLAATLLGVYGLSYSPELNISNFWLGVLGALLCALGWGMEAVIMAHSMKSGQVKDSYALQMRQTVSALVHGCVILPLVGGWGFAWDLVRHPSGAVLPVLALAAFFATFSHFCYFRAIHRIGAAKAMALNVTYAGWSIVFTVLLLRDTSVLTPVTILCTAVVLVCGVLAATDLRELLARNKNPETNS